MTKVDSNRERLCVSRIRKPSGGLLKQSKPKKIVVFKDWGSTVRLLCFNNRSYKQREIGSGSLARFVHF